MRILQILNVFFLPVVLIIANSSMAQPSNETSGKIYQSLQNNSQEKKISLSFSSSIINDFDNDDNISGNAPVYSLLENFISDSTVLVWKNEYSSKLYPAYNNAAAVITDDDGYIYVTGMTTNLPSSFAFWATSRVSLHSRSSTLSKWSVSENTSNLATSRAYSWASAGVRAPSE